MKTTSILILATALCGLCDCQTILDNSLSAGVSGLSSALNNALSVGSKLPPVAQILQGFPDVQRNLTQVVVRYAGRLNGLQKRIVDAIVRVARSVYESVESRFRSLAVYYESTINEYLVPVVNGARRLLAAINGSTGGNGNGGARKRKSILSSPIQSVEDAVSELSSQAGGQIESAAMRMMKWTMNFMKTTGLPWLHNILDKVAASNSTPPSVRLLVQDFDAVYALLQMFGYLA